MKYSLDQWSKIYYKYLVHMFIRFQYTFKDNYTISNNCFSLFCELIYKQSSKEISEYEFEQLRI